MMTIKTITIAITAKTITTSNHVSKLKYNAIAAIVMAANTTNGNVSNALSATTVANVSSN